jgi:hypothetical protein
MNEKIWYKDLKGFLTQDNFLKFFPTADMIYEEQINSIVRFTLYLTILLVLFKNNYKVIYILLVIILITYGMSMIKINDNNNKKEYYQTSNLALSKKTNKPCRRPNVDNPFMNRNILTDYDKKTDMIESCDVENEQIKEEILDKFNEKIYRSVDDMFMNQSNDRQFYTMPNTKLVSDQTEFAKWLYDRGPTCKEGNNQACYENANDHLGVQLYN